MTFTNRIFSDQALRIKMKSDATGSSVSNITYSVCFGLFPFFSGVSLSRDDRETQGAGYANLVYSSIRAIRTRSALRERGSS